jgi:hypothetical protein
MRKYFILIFLMILLFSSGCSSKEDVQRAKKYKLELNYYQNSVKQLDNGLLDKALISCEQTEMLKSECYTSLVQKLMINEQPVKKEYCENIVPDYRMNMTMRAFLLVYAKIDDGLRQELELKINPSYERMEDFQKIKNECLVKSS